MKLFVFEFLIWNSFFTWQLPLDAFKYYFEIFLDITTNLVNCQLMPTPKQFHVHVSTCRHAGIPMVGKVEEEEDLTKILKE